MVSELYSLGITFSEMRILIYLYEQRGDTCTQEALASHLEIDRSNIGRAVHKLEGKGYIWRVKDDMDTRVSHIAVAVAGKQIESKIMTAYAQTSAYLHQYLSDTELRTLAADLKKVAAGSQKQRG